ncbi:MAG: hypothetical protein KJ941_04765 [Bacteroidetes bacterium]|nr:hypothetical protein [Bacteroidota bacterium]
MIKAVIDVGTNTFNLLVAEVNERSFTVIHSEKEGVSLGMGGINENRLAAKSMQRALVTLKRFKLKCDSLQVEQIVALGTSALRDASNQFEFLDLVNKEVGLKIQIITGLEEADLIYKGVKTICSFETEAVIVDIGGGSTEFIFAKKEGVESAISMNIGVSRIYQLFKLSDPISDLDEKKIIEFLEEKSEGRLDNWNCSTLIGSSGSFETFYELIYQHKFPKENKMIEINLDALNSVLDEMKKSTFLEREQNDFIVPFRKIMMPITSVKVQWFIKKIGIKKILISPYSLKEGALYKEIEG